MERLKEIIYKSNIDENRIAEALNMSVVEFWEKFKSKELGVKDAEKLIEILKIRNPCEIFFGKN